MEGERVSRNITLTVPWIPPKEVRGNSRAHWRLKHKKNLLLKRSGQDQAFLAGKTFQKARITFTWFKAGIGDGDNFAIGMKGFVDGLVIGGMFSDDSPEHIVQGEHGFVRVKRADERTEIEIQEIP